MVREILKTSTDKTLGEMRAENAPTRSKVAHTYLVTKTFSKASNYEESKEKALWKVAEGNVFDMVDNEKEDQGEVDKEEYCYEK